jgi:hypothetical protein
VSVSGSSFEAEMMARSKAKGCTAAIPSVFSGGSKKMTGSTVKKEQSSNGYVHSVEAGGDEKD